MVSLKDISETCGVSIGTVSKALNNHLDISAETRARVTEAARNLGYVGKKEILSRPAGSKVIGLVFDEGANRGTFHSLELQVIFGFRKVCEEEGYDLALFSSAQRRLRLSYLLQARRRKCEAVCLVNADYGTQEVHELLTGEFPCVTICHFSDQSLSAVGDSREGMRMLLSYVLEKGHRKIAFVRGQDCRASRLRTSVFLRVMKAQGIAVPKYYLMEEAYEDPERAYFATKRLLDLPDPPTCILYADDICAAGGAAAAASRHLSIPGDLSIAGFGGGIRRMTFYPPLTTVRLNGEQMGQRAAKLLIERLTNPATAEYGPVIMPMELVKGSTVGPAQKSSAAETGISV